MTPQGALAEENIDISYVLASRFAGSKDQKLDYDANNDW